jgi:hypothetical protein
VSQEIDLSVNIAEARINLQKMLDERKEAASELAKLTKELADMDDLDMSQPLAKRPRAPQTFSLDSTYIAGAASAVSPAKYEEDESKVQARLELEDRICRLNEDIECKNIQINEAQQTVIEGDQGMFGLFKI